MPLSVQQAYRHCQATTRSHYENFPVASLLLPRRLRKPVSAIYTFARMADDIADEGDRTDQERVTLLKQAEADLLQAAKGQPNDMPVYIALADVLAETPELLQPLLHLLTAFNQDIHKKRFAHIGEIMEYCRYSANPVGRMLLILYGAASTKNIAYSDAICSALQIINFLQDIQSDYLDRDRIYMSHDELLRFKLDETDLDGHNNHPQLRPFMQFQINRALTLLQSGAPLGIRLHGRLGLELRMMILGGWRVLKKLHENDGDISQNAKLGKSDWLWIASHALTSRFKVYSRKLF